jgi:hydrogenase 3 maturation protease
MSVIEDLTQWLSPARKVVLIGIGNPLRRDDNIGVQIIEGLEGQVSHSVLLIKSETIPENYLEPIIQFKPSHILLIDAALLNTKPGSIQLMHSLPVSRLPISTHILPLQLFCEYLTKLINPKIALLLIQPEDTSFGEGLTHTLNTVRKHLIEQLLQIIKMSVD